MKSISCIYLIPPSAVFNVQAAPGFAAFDKADSTNLYSALVLNHKENFSAIGKKFDVVYCFDNADRDFLPDCFKNEENIFFCNTADKKAAFKLLREKFFTSFSNNIIVFAYSIGYPGNQLEKALNILSMEDETLIIGKCSNNEIAYIGFNNYNDEIFNFVKCDSNNFDELLAITNKHENFIHTEGNFLYIKTMDDFKKLYGELSKKESWSYCSQVMHEQFTHLFIEYKDLLK